MKSTHRPCCASGQTGETLVGLMVGLVLSMVVVLMTLATFKISVVTTAGAAQDAAEDAQTTYSLMRASAAALDVAYGVATTLTLPNRPDVPTHAHVLFGAGMSGSTLTSSNTTITYNTAGNAIVWVRVQGGAASCAGLLYSDANDGSGGLYALSRPSPCSTVGGNTPTSGSGWTATRLTDRSKNTGALSFSLTRSACNPFNLLSSVSGGVVLTISAVNRSGATLSEQACLVNIP
jgi:hypothetical protein